MEVVSFMSCSKLVPDNDVQHDKVRNEVPLVHGKNEHNQPIQKQRRQK